jgi:hypothetical protein
MTPYLLLIPIFAILDRWCGGGMGWRSTFRGRPLYYVAALHPAAYLLDWRVGVILTGWVVWREPKWNLFGGSLAPKGRDEILGTFYRHLLILPVALATWGAPVIVQVITFFYLINWAIFATGLADLNRKYADEGRDANNIVEVGRGAFFGFVACAIMGVA